MFGVNKNEKGQLKVDASDYGDANLAQLGGTSQGSAYFRTAERIILEIDEIHIPQFFKNRLFQQEESQVQNERDQCHLFGA